MHFILATGRTRWKQTHIPFYVSTAHKIWHLCIKASSEQFLQCRLSSTAWPKPYLNATWVQWTSLRLQRADRETGAGEMNCANPLKMDIHRWICETLDEKRVACKDVRQGKWLFTPDTKMKLKSSHQIESRVCACLSASVHEWANMQNSLRGSQVEDNNFHHNFSV